MPTDEMAGVDWETLTQLIVILQVFKLDILVIFVVLYQDKK